MSPEHRESPLQKVQADAYRAYLRAVREGLDNIDIDALDVTAMPAALWQPPAFCLPFCSYCCNPNCFPGGPPTGGGPGHNCQ